MGQAKPGEANRRVQDRRAHEYIPGESTVALLATFVSYAVVDMAFLWRASGFSQWRQVRTEFAFALPTSSIPAVLILFAASMIAALKRQWIAPFGIGLILTTFSWSGYAYSGPGDLIDAVQPLLAFGFAMPFLALLLNAIIMIVWICRSKKKVLGSDAGS